MSVNGYWAMNLLMNSASTENIGIVKKYTGSFSSNVQDNIDKTRKKCRNDIFS